jgi:hypothetical protein
VARVLIAADFQRLTNSEGSVEVSARNYRDLLTELYRRFPELEREVLEKMAIAIDGVIIHEPLLQRFDDDSELVFVPRIAAG